MFFLAVRKRVVSTVKKSCNGKKKGCLTVKKGDVSTVFQQWEKVIWMVFQRWGKMVVSMVKRKVFQRCLNSEKNNDSMLRKKVVSTVKKNVSTMFKWWEKRCLNGKKKSCFNHQKKDVSTVFLWRGKQFCQLWKKDDSTTGLNFAAILQ